MENPITRAEHEEFRRRLEEENKRQDARIGILEDSVRQIGALATSVEKLAVSMQSMLKEQEKQGKRLEALEGRDGEKWRKVMGYIATAIVGVVLGYLFKQIGMFRRSVFSAAFSTLSTLFFTFPRPLTYRSA